VFLQAVKLLKNDMSSSVLFLTHAAFHLHIVFALPHALRGSGYRNALDFLLVRFFS